jgi:hypothetical protein
MRILEFITDDNFMYTELIELHKSLVKYLETEYEYLFKRKDRFFKKVSGGYESVLMFDDFYEKDKFGNSMKIENIKFKYVYIDDKGNKIPVFEYSDGYEFFYNSMKRFQPSYK